MPRSKPYVTAIICIAILSCWLFVALHSGQAPYQTQRSRLLLEYGALDGRLLDLGEYWRLIVSQFCHVRFPHMLGNVALICLLGVYMERWYGRAVLVPVYFLGGLAGLYASVVYNPTLISSGASQALCSLAGFLLIHLRRTWRQSKPIAGAVMLIVALQCGLDLYFASRLKQGHTFGFLAGAAMGLMLLWPPLAARIQSCALRRTRGEQAK